ncbi:hypothetical protein G6F57_023030 [Rhizopus arrhizus]|nr:hypothetical protein G6F57_023030 [Rhizopus arrhizus]
MRNPDARRLFDHARLQLGERGVALRGRERRARVLDQAVDLGVAEIAPVVRRGRESLGADEAHDGEERIHGREADVDGVAAVG